MVAALNAGWVPSPQFLHSMVPGMATGGVIEPYGLPTGTNIGYGGTGFPDWVVELGREHGVQPSTYPGHQESDRNESGYAPNPEHLNRGVDWSGTVEAMQAYAAYLLGIAPSNEGLEQIIWQNPDTGQKIGWSGRSEDTAGSYFAADYPAHRNHVHTRQSSVFGGTAPVTPSPAADPAAVSSAADAGSAAAVTSPDIATTSDAAGGGGTRLKTLRELGSDLGGILADGLVETFDLPKFVADPNVLLEGDDGSNVRTSMTGTSSTAASSAATTAITGAPDTPVAEVGRTGSELYSYNLVKVAKDMGLSEAAATIGNAVGLVESELKMYANSNVPESLQFPHDAVGSDHDSLNYMQQRASMGWGTVAQLMDPVYPAQAFYDALMQVSGWESMDPGAAAQAVQRSAFPGKYATRMGEAAEWVERAGLYDSGGWLPPGGLAVSLLDKPEPLLPADKWSVAERNLAKVDELVAAGAGGGATTNNTFNGYGYTAAEVADEWERRQWRRTSGSDGRNW